MGYFISKTLLFSEAVFDNLVRSQLSHKVPQDVVALSSVYHETQLFFGNCFSRRIKKLLPCPQMRGMAVYDHSIKIEDGSSKHENHLALGI
jgi:hypothetical protein